MELKATHQFSIDQSNSTATTGPGKYYTKIILVFVKYLYITAINYFPFYYNFNKPIILILVVCPEYYFMCGNNTCISKDKLCDGVADCPDGRDETEYCSGKLF